jgi:hypothetical protein
MIDIRDFYDSLTEQNITQNYGEFGKLVQNSTMFGKYHISDYYIGIFGLHVELIEDLKGCEVLGIYDNKTFKIPQLGVTHSSVRMFAWFK